VTQARHDGSSAAQAFFAWPQGAAPPGARPPRHEAGVERDSVILYGWHTVAAALANPARRIRKLTLTENAARRLAEAGIEFRWCTGREIDGPTLRYLYLCYVQTYLEHGNRPYLNLDFFERIHDRITDSLAVVVAERRGTPVAAALNIRHEDRLFGRYWGCTEFVSGLHFETCYLQGIEYSIAHGIRVFEGGAQGEHKLARGMLPVQTWSAHWIEDPVFGPAIADFLHREQPFVDEYVAALHAHSPYRQAPETTPTACQAPSPAGRANQTGKPGG